MAKKIKIKKNNKPLTFSELVDHTHKILFPAMEERFIAKKEFTGFKKEFTGFKNDAIGSLDKIHKKLDTLLAEKTGRRVSGRKTEEIMGDCYKIL